MIHFGKIMIVGGQPENRNCIDALGCRLLRQLDRSQRFVEREHRPAEKSDLLPRNHCERTLAEALKIGQSFRRRIPRFVLPLKDRSHFLAT